MLARPQIIEVPVARYVPVPRVLTAPIVEPEPPPERCAFRGKPAVCVLDALAWIERWRGALERANADRATTAKLGPPGEHP